MCVVDVLCVCDVVFVFYGVCVVFLCFVCVCGDVMVCVSDVLIVYVMCGLFGGKGGFGM